MTHATEDWNDLAAQAASGFFLQGPISNEAAFYDLARAHVDQVQIDQAHGLLARAVLGGLYADRFAWVFLAGYQPAIQHTFLNRAFDDWASFAVSEDRTGELPPVTWTAQDNGFVLNGVKTWVAGVEHMRHLIVKAGRGPQARYFVIDRAQSGLRLSTKREGFLAEMTEGIAELNNVRLSQDDLLDAADVKQFGTREFLYIYGAFCGLVAGHCNADHLVGQAWSLIKRIGQILEVPGDLAELKAVDVAIQQLRREGQSQVRDVVGWENDQRLIAIYSKPIQARMM
jgi:hypothetical protein